MFEIKNEGAMLKVTVSGTYPIGNFTWPLFFECNHESYAKLLAQNLRDHMTSKLEEARREAYNEGWKDAKAKTRKKTWFKGWW